MDRSFLLNKDNSVWLTLTSLLLLLLLLPTLLPAKIITTRPRGESMSWSIKCGLAHTSQDSASTKSTVLQSTAKVATLRLHHSYAGISTDTLFLRESFWGKGFLAIWEKKGA